MRKAIIEALERYAFLAQAAIVVVLTGATGVTLNVIEYQNDLTRLRLSIYEQGRLVRSSLQVELTEKVLMARSLATVIESNPDITAEEFRIVADKIRNLNPDVINIAAAPDQVVRFVNPLEPNRSVLGLDYTQSEQYMPSVQATLDTGRAVVAGPVPLVQGGEGFVVRSVVSPYTADYSSKPWGTVGIVVDKESVLESIWPTISEGNLEVAIEAEGIPGNANNTILGDASIFDKDPILLDVPLPIGSWKIAVAPARGWPLRAPGFWNTWLGLVAIGSVLLFAIYMLQKSRREREAARRRLRNAIEAIEDGFALYDKDDRLLIWNKQYEEFYPRSSDLFQRGAKFEDIIRGGAYRGEYQDAVGREEEWIAERMAMHKSADRTTFQNLADGRWLKVAEKKMEDGSHVGFRVDITELVLAKQAAEASDIAKTEFLDGISHELRTPLAVLLGFTKMLQHGELLPSVRALSEQAASGSAEAKQVLAALEPVLLDVRQQAEKIDKAGNQLSSMVAKILDFSDMEKTGTASDTETVSVDRVMNETRSALTSQFEDRSVKLTVEESNLQIRANRDGVSKAVRYALISLLERVADSEVRLSASRNDAHVRIFIRAMEDCRAIAESLSLESCKDRVLGQDNFFDTLNFAIARRLVETQGGWLSAREASDGQVEIMLAFPANSVEPQQVSQRRVATG